MAASESDFPLLLSPLEHAANAVRSAPWDPSEERMSLQLHMRRLSLCLCPVWSRFSSSTGITDKKNDTQATIGMCVAAARRLRPTGIPLIQSFAGM